MPIRPIIDNIVTGADAAGSGAANRTRSVNAASSRVNQMGEVLGITSDILKNEEVMKTLPKDLQARLQLGEPAAMLEATMHVHTERRDSEIHPTGQGAVQVSWRRSWFPNVG
jgi:hypothetical protein